LFQLAATRKINTNSEASNTASRTIVCLVSFFFESKSASTSQLVPLRPSSHSQTGSPVATDNVHFPLLEQPPTLSHRTVVMVAEGSGGREHDT
jgi:hypothetical protein